MHRPKIGIFPAQELSRRQRLLQALEEIYSIEFVACQQLERAAFEAALLFGVTPEQASAAANTGLRCMAFLPTDHAPLSVSADVHLTKSAFLPQSLRGRTLAHRDLKCIGRLEEKEGDEVVARKGENILWIHRSAGAAALDVVATEAPDLTEKDYLFRFFQTNNWALLLPILHFLQEVSGWEPPPVRACFMFDDPNLHWKSYGYVKYHELIRDAHERNYHASFATVPMDAWYVNRETARLFRENRSRISLVIHGNNHTYHELTQAHTDRSRQVLAVQALNRIRRLERLSGLEIPRVMAAPHGYCNHEMASVLLRAGFEAACLPRNPNVVWPSTFGVSPAEFLGVGLPVILRFDIQREYSETILLLAAFLGQPIIPCGHHQDFADGLDLVGRIASLVNSVAEVQWMDLQSIAQTNFCRRHEGDVLHVKMYSRKIRLKVPKGIKTLCVQRPWLHANGEEDLAVQKIGSTFETVISYQDQPISVTPGDEMMIDSICPGMIDFDKVPLPRSSMWAVARRQLSEVRDRLQPTMDRLFASKNGKLQRSVS